jgi:ribosomal protein S18 acetylase RimI-like enzyme
MDEMGGYGVPSNKGIGRQLLSYLTYLARRPGLLGFTAEVLVDNRPMLHLLRLFEQMGFEIERKMESGVSELKIVFKGIS